MNEKLTAEFDIPCAGLGLGVFTGCIAACFAEPAAKYVGIAVAVFLLILSLARRKRQFLAAGLLFGLVSMTAWQLCCAAPLESLAGSDIRTECRIVSVNSDGVLEIVTGNLMLQGSAGSRQLDEELFNAFGKKVRAIVKPEETENAAGEEISAVKELLRKAEQLNIEVQYK